MTRLISKITLVLILMLIACEALLHLFPLPDPYSLLRTSEASRVHLFLPGWNAFGDWFGKTPPFKITYHTGPLIGVATTDVEFSVNRYGFPYDEGKSTRKEKDEIRIGVVGGSTVECSALEKRKRWPDVLERLLASKTKTRTVTVLNLGVSGQDTRTHLATVAQHAVKLDLDYLIFMLGANDLSRTDPADPLNREDAFISQEHLIVKPFLMKFQLARRLRVLYNNRMGTGFYADAGTEDRPYFAVRAREKLRMPILPTAKKDILAQAMDDYEKNIISLTALAVAHKISPIFTTQPMLWKPVMSSREEAVDWLAGTVLSDGRNYRVPPSEQARALEALNRRLLDTCSRRHLTCIDLEKKIPRSLQFFYDSVHLNEAGAEGVASHVAESILGDLSRPATHVR